MNIREEIKKRLTFEQRRRIIRKWVGLRATFAPGRVRARNLPKLPNGRKWRTDLSTALLWSFQGGTLTYQYRNIPMLKHPVEIALYMRLIWETKPGTIIEIGTHSGGAAVWMSDLLTMFGIDGRIVSIDLEPPAPPYHPAKCHVSARRRARPRADAAWRAFVAIPAAVVGHRGRRAPLQ